jgi:hypothetical protein
MDSVHGESAKRFQCDVCPLSYSRREHLKVQNINFFLHQLAGLHHTTHNFTHRCTVPPEAHSLFPPPPPPAGPTEKGCVPKMTSELM